MLQIDKAYSIYRHLYQYTNQHRNKVFYKYFYLGIGMFIKNKYFKLYYSIINHARQTNDIGLFEIHHIIPKSLGGLNDPNNLVKLTYRQHFICHRLLTKMTTGKDKSKMEYAMWRMVNTKHYIINSKLYSHLREKHSKFVSVQKTGIKRKSFSNVTRKKMSESHKGELNYRFNNPHSDESKKKMSENRKGKTDNNKNPAYIHTKYKFYNKEYGEVYDTPHNLCKKYNLDRSNITSLIKGKGKSVKGWIII